MLQLAEFFSACIWKQQNIEASFVCHHDVPIVMLGQYGLWQANGLAFAQR
ncbi:hypothetical protein F652_4082 [Enterobacteriaceae bacterium bta3-1]|nr:hypothetical protein F652_4082 [Enterobacteriaceae bacterium bta3-1]